MSQLTGAALAVEKFGSQTELAKFLDVTQPAICHWLYRDGNKVPLKWVDKLSRKLRVSARILREDALPLTDADSVRKSKRYTTTSNVAVAA